MRTRVAVLMYHDVTLATGDGYTVSRDRLSSDLDAIRGPGRLPCEITFDDGCVGTYVHALPLLVASGLSSTLFVISSRVGRRGYVDRDMLREWHAAGQRVGSHGATHRALTELGDAELYRELAESKAVLEDCVGGAITDVAAPGGNEDARVRRMAVRAGYERLYTSRPGFARPGRRLVPRFTIRAGTPRRAVQLLRRGRGLLLFGPDLGRWALKRLLGVNGYGTLKRRVEGHLGTH